MRVPTSGPQAGRPQPASPHLHTTATLLAILFSERTTTSSAKTKKYDKYDASLVYISFKENRKKKKAS